MSAAPETMSIDPGQLPPGENPDIRAQLRLASVYELEGEANHRLTVGISRGGLVLTDIYPESQGGGYAKEVSVISSEAKSRRWRGGLASEIDRRGSWDRLSPTARMMVLQRIEHILENEHLQEV